MRRPSAPAIQERGREGTGSGAVGSPGARAPWAAWRRGWRETTRHWVRACLKPEGCWQELGKGGAGEPWFPLTPGASVPPGDAPRSAPRRTGTTAPRRGRAVPPFGACLCLRSGPSAGTRAPGSFQAEDGRLRGKPVGGTRGATVAGRRSGRARLLRETAHSDGR